MLAETFPYLQHITISRRTAKGANVETVRVLLENFKYRDLRWLHDRGMKMKTVIEPLIGMRRHIPVLFQM